MIPGSIGPRIMRFSMGGEGEIRTLETLITSARFRGGCLQPLDHLSALRPSGANSRWFAPPEQTLL